MAGVDRMLSAQPLTADNIALLAALYEDYRANARDLYRLGHDAIAFEQLAQGVRQGFFEGYLVLDDAEPEPLAFMLLVLEAHRAYEINIIHIAAPHRETRWKAITDTLMRRLIADLKPRQNYDVVSYAMLGAQDFLVQTLPWYGFRPVGQAVTQYDIMDMVSLQILKQQQLPALPPGYRLVRWQPALAGEAAACVHAAFQHSADALWDPRFRTLMGCRKVVAMITGDLMGPHLSGCTALLVRDNPDGGQVVGFCFLIQATMEEGNIPLIGVHPDEKHKGFGSQLLKFTLEGVLDGILGGRIGMLRISATHDTDNIAAIKLYRRMSFREEHHYPHVALTREKVLAFQPGLWCAPTQTTPVSPAEVAS